MQKISIISGALLVAVNLAVHFIFPAYGWFKCGLVAVITILSVILVNVTSVVKMKDTFRYSLNVLFSFAFVIEIVLGLFSPQTIKNNFILLTIIILFVMKVILLIVSNFISVKSKK